MGKFVSQNNLSYFWQKIKTLLGGKADKSEIPTNTVKYSSQSLTDAQKTQARTNIGAGTSNFSGSYNDLSNKPTIPDVSGFATTTQVNAKLTGTKYNASNPDVYCGYNAESNDNAEYMMAFKNNNNVYGFCHSQFANLTNSSKSPSACTFNGFFYVSSTTNSLSGADANPFLQYHTSQSDFRILTTAYSDIWLQQIATDFRSPHVYIRRKENGTWSDWVKLASSSDLSSYLPKSGGTLTGHLYGQYLSGTWLQTTSSTDLGSAPPKIAVLDNSGWVYYRTLAEMKTDLGVPKMVTLTQAEYDALATKDSNTYYFIKE